MLKRPQFTKAIELDPSNVVLYANRAACHQASKRFVLGARQYHRLSNPWALTIFEDMMTPFRCEKGHFNKVFS